VVFYFSLILSKMHAHLSLGVSACMDPPILTASFPNKTMARVEPSFEASHFPAF